MENKNAQEFVKTHFKGIENETWYPAIVAIAEGYAKQEQIIVERQEELLNECWLKLQSLRPTNPGLGSLTFRIKQYRHLKSYKEDYLDRLKSDKWIEIGEKEVGPEIGTEILVVADYTKYGRKKHVQIAMVNFSVVKIPYGGPNSISGSGLLDGIFFSVPAILAPGIVTHWKPLPKTP